MSDNLKFSVTRFLEELGIEETDYMFVYDVDGNPKTMHIPWHLDDNDLMPESVTAALDVYYAYLTKVNKPPRLQ